MEFLLAVLVVAFGVYIGYQYYKVKTATGHEPTVLDLVEEVKVDVEAVEAKAEVAVEVVKTEVKKAAPKVKKAAKKVAAEVVEEAKEVKAKVVKKKKPNIKVAE